MTYSEDYPAFAGDQTGQLLAEPDMVALSPVTSARVVETQSGYLVVLKKVDDRLSLSVKRRIGTPPSSQVVLTPDESLQLSRVLADSVETLGAVRGDFLIREIGGDRGAAANGAPRQEPGLDSDTRSTRAYDGLNQRSDDPLRENVSAPDTFTQPSGQSDLSTIYGDKTNDPDSLDWDEIKQPWRKRKTKQSSESIETPAQQFLQEQQERGGLITKPVMMIGGGIAAVVAVIAVVIGITSVFNSQPNEASKPVTAQKAAEEPMNADKVDKFVRNFVADMLDFNPKSYRSSQVHAMAVMNRETMEKYWTETGFPLSRGKLMNLPRNQTLIINKVLQQPISSTRTDIELSADLVSPGESEPTKIRLEIDLGLDNDNQLVVTDMKDASAKMAEEEAAAKR